MDLAIQTQSETSNAITKDLTDKVGAYLRASKSENTLRAYKSSWDIFQRWCSDHRLVALPAAAETIGAFLADQGGKFRVATIELRVAAIKAAHDLAHQPSPTRSVEVATIMQGIRRMHGTAHKRKAPLMVGDVRAVCGRLGDDLRGRRDRALLLLGFTGGFRRSELVNLDVEDIAFKAEGMVVTITRSKTDQTGKGRTIGIGYGADEATCPVTAVRRWIAASVIKTGPLLRGVDRHGHVMDRRLSPHSVGRLVKQLGRQVGLDPCQLGGHSLRSGFATSAAAAGISEGDISRITGHASVAMVRYYASAGTAFKGDLVQRLGL